MLLESFLQYFRPSLSYILSLQPLFCLFLSGRFRQVLLYQYIVHYHVTKMSSMPYKVKTIKKSSSLEGHLPSLVLVCNIRDMDPTKFFKMMI